MARTTTIAAGILLGTGIAISLPSASILLNPNSSVQSRWFSGLALITLGLPPITRGAKMVLKAQDEARQEQKRLRAAFYDALKASGGKISVLHFAMQSKITGDEAKAYLDERAKEFNASFEVSEGGKVIYDFELGADSSLSARLTKSQDSYDVILSKPASGWDSPFWGSSVLKEIEERVSIELSAEVRRQIKRGKYPVTLASGLSRAEAKKMRQAIETCPHYGLDAEIQPTQEL